MSARMYKVLHGVGMRAGECAAVCALAQAELTCCTSRAPTILLLPLMPTYRLRSNCFASVPVASVVLSAAAETR